MLSDLVELRALQSDMRHLVDAVQNLQSPSSPRTTQPEFMQPPPPAAPVEVDDWPAPPPWPDAAMIGLLHADLPLPPLPHNSVQATVEIQYVKEEAISPLLLSRLRACYKFRSQRMASFLLPDHWRTLLLINVSGLSRFSLHCSHSVCLQLSLRILQLVVFSRACQDAIPSSSLVGQKCSHNHCLQSGPLIFQSPATMDHAPIIHNFSHRDPSKFAWLKLSVQNLLPPEATELFKYQVLVDHLQLEGARLIADTYLNSPTPFSDMMVALNDKFGQPHQIALRHIAAVLDSPDIRRGDVAAF